MESFESGSAPGGGGGVGEGLKKGFEGQDGFTGEHEISGLREETKSDTLHGLERRLPVTSVMLNALCVD